MNRGHAPISTFTCLNGKISQVVLPVPTVIAFSFHCYLQARPLSHVIFGQFRSTLATTSRAQRGPLAVCDSTRIHTSPTCRLQVESPILMVFLRMPGQVTEDVAHLLSP